MVVGRGQAGSTQLQSSEPDTKRKMWSGHMRLTQLLDSELKFKNFICALFIVNPDTEEGGSDTREPIGLYCRSF